MVQNPDSKTILEIGISDANMFRQCRLKWRLGSKTQLNLERRIPQTALWLGTGVHLALEAYYKAKLNGEIIDICEVFDDWATQWMEKIRIDAPFMGPEEDQELQETRELGLGMLHNYELWAPDNDRFDIVKVEEGFEYKLYEDAEFIVIYKGRIDLLVKDDEGFWLVEHKTTRLRTFDTRRLLLDEQVGAYVWAASQMVGEQLVGCKYSYLRKKLPSIPKELVAGGLSKAKSIDTTEDVYQDCINEHGLNPDDYADILEILKEKGNTFFYREDVFRSSKELVILMKRLVNIALEMHRVNQSKLYYPTPDPMLCPMCTFMPVCISRAEGGDDEFLIRNQYRPRTKDELVWVNSPAEDGVIE